MKRVFICSLCHNGVLGGALYLDDNSITYRTNKLTVEKKYKNYVIPLDTIKDITWKRVVFPLVTFTTTDNEKTTFVLFNKKRFLKCYDEVTMIDE